MTPRFNVFFRWFARRFFGHFELGEPAVEQLRELERGGAVVYVMRYSSRLDYLLFNTLFLREGLRLSSFANGIHFYYYRPLLQLLARFLSRRRWRRRQVEHDEDRAYVRRLVRDGDSLFLFLRTARFRTYWRGLRRRRQRHDELDLLQEVVSEIWDSGRPLQLVPLCLFWRKGPRKDNRFLNLDYGALTRPSDMAKVASFLATYRDLSVKVGEPIDLAGYIAEHREDGVERVTRLARRSVLVQLSREEKVVEGPTLRAPQRVMREVMADRGVRAAMQARAAQKGSSPELARREAEKMFREIAARMNSTLLAVLATLVGAILRRMFASIETVGMDKVAEYAKRHPLVLVPNHRSYFDFLIISLLFYSNYMVPPHIAARDNMAFGPFGAIFRLAGAFYLRRSFDDPLYKQVFRAYVAHLVREGFTQEFFIEGGRSRTGKTLAPRLGMLTWDVDAFLECHRRDLFFVPIAITYERLVEESGIVGELEGGEKTRESTLALFRARKVLQRRFGSVHVSFGEPISLAGALGERRERFQRLVRGEIGPTAGRAPDETKGALEDEKRQFIDVLAHRIVERINWAVVANATSVAAAVLLGAAHRGILRTELVARMRCLVELLELQDVRVTAALEADRGEFAESIAFLLRSDLIRATADPRGEILYFDESRRRALDLYRNSIVHYLAAPSILARRLLRGGSEKELREDLSTWQEILYQEFFVPRGEVLAAHCEGFLDHFERTGWIEHRGDLLVATRAGETFLRCLAAQTQGVIECYEAALQTLLHAKGSISRRDYMEAVAASFANARLLGLVEHPEAASETTFGNVLELLVRRGILEVHVLKAHREDRKVAASQITYTPGENGYALGELWERLAAALSAG